MRSTSDSASGFVLPFALLLLVAVVGGTAQAQNSSGEWVPFISRSGGFELEMPAAWHTRELPGDIFYQGMLSREPLLRDGDVYRVGATVIRLRDWRNGFSFSAKRNADIAREYADQMAAVSGRPGRVSPATASATMDGLEAFGFQVTTGEGTERCVNLWLVVGIGKKREWFGAQWEAPCQESGQEREAIQRMMNSLRVRSSWGS